MLPLDIDNARILPQSLADCKDHRFGGAAGQFDDSTRLLDEERFSDSFKTRRPDGAVSVTGGERYGR